ncbi:MAG: polysaccharide biosynthesis C-terminal domain-containing protein [Bacteroidales bacterium]
MKKRFLSNLALLIALNLLIKPFWFFGIEVGVQNRVGESEYGFYFSLFNFALILNILLDLGIQNYNNRAIARNPRLLPGHLTAIVPLKFALALLYAVVAFVAARFLGYDREQMHLLRVLAFNQFLASFILYFRTNISGLHLFRTDSLLSVMDRTLMILITGLLLWGRILDAPFRIQWFAYAQTASYGITLLTVVLLVRSHTGGKLPPIRLASSLTILKASLPFALLILLMATFNRIDSVMLERMLPDGKREAGIYAQSFRIYDALSQFSLLFAALLLPMFSRMLRKKENVNDLIRLALPLLLVTGITAAVAGNAYKQEIIRFLYDSPSGTSGKIFGILILGFLCVSVSYVYGTLLTANRNLKVLNLLAASTVVLNLSLNLILIPHHGALGAAWSSFISQAYYALMQVILAGRILHLPSNRDLLLRLIPLLGASVGSAFLVRQLVPGWGMGFVLILAVSALVSLALGLIRPREVRSILQNEES